MYTTIARILELIAWVGLFWFAIALAFTRRWGYGLATLVTLITVAWRHIPWLGFVRSAAVSYLLPNNRTGLVVYLLLVLLPWVYFVLDERKRHEVLAGWNHYLGYSDGRGKKQQ